MGLTARTRRSDVDFDLLTVAGGAGGPGLFFERGRGGMAARGVARRVPAAEAVATLAAIEVDDDVGLAGCGPIAFGALPFRPGADAELVVPAEIWGRSDDGTRWHTTITSGRPAAGSTDAAARTQPRPEAPSRFMIEPGMAPARWCELVERATKAIAQGPLRKVVLAREVVVTAEQPIDVGEVVARLRAAYPGCYVFHVEGFVGASPELLVSRSGDIVRAQPMAGTAPRGGDPTTDARLAASLLASAKDRAEHQITIDRVHDTLLPWCSYLDDEAEPSVVPVANVQHLATMVEGRLSSPAPSVLELVHALHPTPAVCGDPHEEALAFIAAHEGFDRRRYAGAVGWVDAQGNGQWAVSIRCAEIDGRSARTFAGNGIVADSDPATELAETRAKLQAVLSAIVRP